MHRTSVHERQGVMQEHLDAPVDRDILRQVCVSKAHVHGLQHSVHRVQRLPYLPQSG